MIEVYGKEITDIEYENGWILNELSVLGGGGMNNPLKLVWVHPSAMEECFYSEQYCKLCDKLTEHLLFEKYYPNRFDLNKITATKKICCEHSMADDTDNWKAFFGRVLNHRLRWIANSGKEYMF